MTQHSLCLSLLFAVLLTIRSGAEEPCSKTKVQIKLSRSAPSLGQDDRADPAKSITFKTPILIGDARLPQKNSWTWAEASFIGDFFDGLKRDYRDGKFVFSNADQVIENYPSKTVIEVDLIVEPELGKQLRPEAKQSIRFEVLNGDSPLASSTERTKSAWRELPGETAAYLLTVQTSGVPLRNRLTINLYRGEQFIGCVCGGL